MSELPEPRAGVLFDMDGTLVDTEPLWHRAERELADEHGVPWSAADSERFTGAPMETWSGEMRRRGWDVPVDEIIAAGVAKVVGWVRGGGVPWLPGARELLAGLAEAGVPCALVTNAAAANAAAVMEAAPPGALAFAVSADDVTNAKPDPEPYATAAARLGIDPGRSLAIEDSASGARSAAAAGLGVWFLDTHTADPGVPVARTLSSLAEVTVDDVLGVLRADAR